MKLQKSESNLEIDSIIVNYCYNVPLIEPPFQLSELAKIFLSLHGYSEMKQCINCLFHIHFKTLKNHRKNAKYHQLSKT